MRRQPDRSQAVQRALRLRNKFVEEFQLLTGPRSRFVTGGIGVKLDGSAITVRLNRPLPKSLELPTSYEGLTVEVRVPGKIVPRSGRRG